MSYYSICKGLNVLCYSAALFSNLFSPHTIFHLIPSSPLHHLEVLLMLLHLTMTGFPSLLTFSHFIKTFAAIF